jgi:hypothetical protein
MAAKIITLTVSDQNLLRVALDKAIDGRGLPYTLKDVNDELTLVGRIKDLKARLT